MTDETTPRANAPIPPAPGWWLASDGNWYPPQATPGGPPPTGFPMSPQPMVQQKSGPNVVAIILGAIAAVFLLFILCIVAITFLGQKASSKFSSVGTRVGGTIVVTPP